MSDNYNGLTLSQLRPIAKEKYIKNVYRLRKSELIEALIAYDEKKQTQEENQTKLYANRKKNDLIVEIEKRKLYYKNIWKKSQLIDVLIKDDFKNMDELSRSTQENIECCVCYEDMPYNMVTKCNHPVCKICINQLLKDECPMCKRKLETPYKDEAMKASLNDTNQRNSFLDYVTASVMAQMDPANPSVIPILAGLEPASIPSIADEFRAYADAVWIDEVGGVDYAFRNGFRSLFRSYILHPARGYRFRQRNNN